MRRTIVYLVSLLLLIISMVSIVGQTSYTNIILVSKNKIEWHFISSAKNLESLLYVFTTSPRDGILEINVSMPISKARNNSSVSSRLILDVESYDRNATDIYVEIHSELRSYKNSTLLIVEEVRSRINVDSDEVSIPWYTYTITLKSERITNISEVRSELSKYLNEIIKNLNLTFVKSIKGRLEVSRLDTYGVRYEIELYDILMDKKLYEEKLFTKPGYCEPQYQELVSKISLSTSLTSERMDVKLEIDGRTLLDPVYTTHTLLCTIPLLGVFNTLLETSNISFLKTSITNTIITSIPDMSKLIINPSIKAYTNAIPLLTRIFNTTNFAFRFMLHSYDDYIALESIVLAPNTTNINYTLLMDELIDVFDDMPLLSNTGITLANPYTAKVVLESNNQIKEGPVFSHALPEKSKVKGLEVVLLIVIVLVSIQTGIIIFFILKALKKKSSLSA